jgi:hypothetical protein
MQTLFNAYGHTGIAKEFGEWWLVEWGYINGLQC